jgi:uncharacterized OB-fold protein
MMTSYVISCSTCEKSFSTPRLICDKCGESGFVKKAVTKAELLASTTIIRQPGEILTIPVTIELMRTIEGSYFIHRN